jgi:hypothetical protein
MQLLEKIGLALLRLLDWIIQTILVGMLAQWVGAVIGFFKPVLHPTRGVLILIVACGLALAFTDQGQELARSLALNPFSAGGQFGKWLASIVVPMAAMTWWAVQSWWWSRVLLDRRFDDGTMTLSQHSRRVVWTPRLYALAVFAIAAIPLIFDHRWIDVIIIAVIAAIVLWILIRRRSSPFLKRLLVAPEKQDETSRAQPGHGPRLTIKAFADFSRHGLVMLALSFALPIAMLAASWLCRTEVAFFLGTLAVTFIAMACILPILATLTISETSSRAPILVGLAVWVAIVAAILTVARWDNHEVRAFAGGGDRPALTADTALQNWTAQNGPDEPLILVYSAGGGLRAAYWTAALLGTLEDETSRFHCRLFAISGVSGGSVGAVFWAGAVRAGLPAQGDGCAAGTAKLRPVVQKALAKDYLAPGLTGLLFGDLLRAFLPFPGEDRAVALEKAWEAGFRRETGSEALAGGFHDLWPSPSEGRWMPILLLNGTQEETGQRIITSNIAIADEIFPKAHDFFEEFGREVPASTAALNSARFTYVSPAGRITSADGKTDYGHILDGGYFENYGARTIGDLFAALNRDDRLKDRRVILIEMINDTDLADDDASRCTTKSKAPRVLWSGTLNEIVAPIKGMLMARQARGMVDARMTANAVVPGFCGLQDGNAPQGGNPPPRLFVQLRICPGLTPSPPLGWVMGDASVENIRKLIDGEIPVEAIGPHGEPLGACAKQLRERLANLKRVLSE